MDRAHPDLSPLHAKSFSGLAPGNYEVRAIAVHQGKRTSPCMSTYYELTYNVVADVGGVPVGLDVFHFEVGAQIGQQTLPLDRGVAFGGEVMFISSELGASSSKAVHERQFVDDIEPAHPA